MDNPPPSHPHRKPAARLPVAIAFAVAALVCGPAAAEPSDRVGGVRLERFASTLAESISSGDGMVLEEHLDVDALLDRILLGIHLDTDTLGEFRRGFKKGMGPGQLLQGVLGQRFHFLAIREFEGRQRPFFRLILDEGGLNYLVFDVRSGADGEIVIHDFYTFATGEWLSDSIRRIVLPALAHADRSLLEKIFSPADADYVRHLDEVGRMSRSYQAGEFETAVSLFLSLPRSLQEQKLINVTFLSALAELEDREEEYKAAMSRFEKLFPGDPALKLMLVDYHMLNGDWDAMFQDLDWLENSVGGDPYTDVLRASGMVFKEDWAAARRFALRAAEREPELEDAYWTLVTVALNVADHAAVVQGLSWLQDRFGYFFDVQTLEQEPLYAEFLSSPQARDFFSPRN